MDESLRRTILVIDDDTHLQEIFRLTLERAGYQVIARANALTGLKWLEQILPDLVLLDIMLPDISGIELLQRLRQTENGREVPVMVATASSQLHDQDFAAYNIIRLVHKPLLPNDLVKLVRDFFAQSE